MAKRDTYKYELTRGNKVVYVGTTNDPERREQEHRQNKNFDKMRLVGNVSTQSGALQWETERIQTYMRNHNGKTPEYNKNEHGK
jgi:predicted GIY-YIG superfamily endonuclease